MDAGVDPYRLGEEYEAIRAAVRAICVDKVAPHAAEVDETAQFPEASYDALRAADFHAPHIPEEYGGAGADALATCIVIERWPGRARRRRSSRRSTSSARCPCCWRDQRALRTVICP